MPFDGAKYEQKLTFNLAGLIAWLKLQPPEQTYVYTRSADCLAAQFNKACGQSYSVPCCESLEKHAYQGEFEKVLELVALPKPHTMIGALQRAWQLK